MNNLLSELRPRGIVSVSLLPGVRILDAITLVPERAEIRTRAGFPPIVLALILVSSNLVGSFEIDVGDGTVGQLNTITIDLAGEPRRSGATGLDRKEEDCLRSVRLVSAIRTSQRVSANACEP